MGRIIHNKKCKDCGKPIFYKSVRCRGCSNKHRSKNRAETLKKIHFGKENGNWKGGVSSAYYLKLQKEYLKNLCYFCQVNFKLSVHHKDGNRRNNQIKNLVVVCRSCHKKLHDLIKAYGR